MKQFWWHQLFFLAFCLFWMSSVQAQSSIDLIASFGPAYSDSIDKGDGLAKRKARASLDPEALSLLATGKRVSSLRVSLFSDVVLDLQGIKSDVRLTETVVNEFSISGDKKGRAVLSVTGGVLYGTVTTGANVVYRLQREAKDVYLIEELDQSKFPECANPSGPGESSNLEKPTNSSAIAPSTNAVTSEDDGTLVTVLVAYTNAAETAAGGASSIASLIATAESETNTGYSTSGINFVINVVNTTKVTYNEATGYSAALNAITDTSDGLMDSVHGLRDTYSADLVVLIIDNSESCGIAWKPSTVSSSNASFGFSVVGWNCATGYYSFAHEMGHNMGVGHDTYVDSSTLPYAYGHGFVNTSAQVRSIMAYNSLCGDSGFSCSRVNHWSATDRLYNGSTVIGDASATNNVALNNSAYSISNYRSSPPASPPNPPTLVDASDGTNSDRIELSWSVVAEATSYNVYYSSSLESTQTLLGAYTSTSINVTGTAPGVVWYFWVYSVNTNGESATGTYDTGYVQSENQADLAITILDATNGTYASGDNLDVIAKIENIGNAISESYRITFYASTDTNITPEDYGDLYWDLDALAVGENDYYLFPWILSQSMPDGQYYIGAIVTVNDDSDGSNNSKYDESPITIYNPPPIPSAPQNLSATDGVYSDKVQVTWSDVADETSYQVFRCSTSSTDSCGAAIATPGANSTSHDDFGASADGTVHYYRVKACNDGGCSDFSAADTGHRQAFIPTVPDAPTDVTASAGNASATVSFNAPADDGGSAITSYTVTSNPGGFSATGANSPITVTGLTNGTNYTFTVFATNAVGDGASSDVSNSVVPSAATDHFVTTWKTDNYGTTNDTSIMVPMVGGPFDVDWDNDGTFDEFGLSGSVTHDYGIAGTYTIRITGNYDSISFGGVSGPDSGNYKILSIDQWGTNSWTSMEKAFRRAWNLQVPATDTPDLSAVTSMWVMFLNAPLANPDTIGWDTSKVTSMRSMFRGATSFDQDIGSWDVTSLTNAEDMFYEVTLSQTNYESLLIGWNAQELRPGVTFSGGNSTYCSQAAATARANMIAVDGWTITDGGQDCGLIFEDGFESSP